VASRRSSESIRLADLFKKETEDCNGCVTSTQAGFFWGSLTHQRGDLFCVQRYRRDGARYAAVSTVVFGKVRRVAYLLSGRLDGAFD